VRISVRPLTHFNQVAIIAYVSVQCQPQNCLYSEFYYILFGPVFSHQNASDGPEIEAYDPHVGQTTEQADTAYFGGEKPVMGQME
jgi:hypothetical protein